jgi:hypothetical protein
MDIDKIVGNGIIIDDIIKVENYIFNDEIVCSGLLQDNITVRLILLKK